MMRDGVPVGCLWGVFTFRMETDSVKLWIFYAMVSFFSSSSIVPSLFLTFRRYMSRWIDVWVN